MFLETGPGRTPCHVTEWQIALLSLSCPKVEQPLPGPSIVHNVIVNSSLNLISYPHTHKVFLMALGKPAPALAP